MKENIIVAKAREYAIPLILGVIVALVWANVSPEGYIKFATFDIFSGVNVNFLVNDIFMVFFFAIAAVEITKTFTGGGEHNSLKEAINPLIATIGGVVGPIILFFVLNSFMGSPAYTRGWGIVTATDIALAWLVARLVFGAHHPAVNFLLLLAIVDDAIGLVIIAVFYPNPLHPTEPVWLLLVLAGVLISFVLRKIDVRSHWIYTILGGGLCWIGLHNAHLHPALALVFVVPFMPSVGKVIRVKKVDADNLPQPSAAKADSGNPQPSSTKSDADGLQSSVTKAGADSPQPSVTKAGADGKQQANNPTKQAEQGNLQPTTAASLTSTSVLDSFEHSWQLFVDFGLFFFGLANAGVHFAGAGALTAIVFLGLVVGKPLGVFSFGMFAKMIGFAPPKGIGTRELLLIGIVAGIGLSVALFMSDTAFPLSASAPANTALQQAAKMGALASVTTAIVAMGAKRMLRRN